MNETHLMIGAKVTYDGDNREYLRGKIGVVERVSDTGAYGVRFEDGSLEWGASWSWASVFPEPEPKMADLDLMNPHSASISAIDNEVKRLHERIAELEITRKVLASL
jgi:hypothetical protein